MSDIVIRAENLSKLYRIGEREQYGVLRDVLARAASAPFRMFRPRKPQSANGDATHIWALKDVSFEVHQGEVVGIIGRNGAGKSTLLKILSRVTKPTMGYADVRGRMGSLLEVGTGFHPELTGRENTYLNGAILGMSKKEVARKFDEIVAFAEVAKFIDTPIKHYSSGMYLRLAFSVAAHLETEILIVDEVLAVGDVQFQKKCLGKMQSVSEQGRTVIFVSHNIAAIQRLTKRSVLLEAGKVGGEGESEGIITQYLEMAADFSNGVTDVSNMTRPYTGLNRKVEFLRLEIENSPSRVIPPDGDVTLRVTLRGNESIAAFRMGLTIFKRDGTPVGSSWTSPTLSIEKGAEGIFRITLREAHLAPGRYHLALGTSQPKAPMTYEALDVITEVLPFEVLPYRDAHEMAVRWAPGWGSVRFGDLQASRME